MKPDRNPRPGNDLNTRAIVAVALAFLILPLAAMSVVELIHRKPGRVSAGEPPPAPRLQTGSDTDRTGREQADSKRLHHFGWVNRKKGIVHIPIENAMATLVEDRQKSDKDASP